MLFVFEITKIIIENPPKTMTTKLYIVLTRAQQSTYEDEDVDNASRNWLMVWENEGLDEDAATAHGVTPADPQTHHNFSKQAQAISEKNRLPKTHTADRQIP